MDTEHSRQIGNRVIILSNQVKHYLHWAAEEEGISGSQSRILHYLAVSEGKHPVYQKDVEDFFCLRRSTVTQNLQAMEKNNLICRMNVKEDARLKKLELTEEGKKLEAKIHTKVEAMERELGSCLTESEREQFLALMGKLDNAMDKLGYSKSGLVRKE